MVRHHRSQTETDVERGEPLMAVAAQSVPTVPTVPRHHRYWSGDFVRGGDRTANTDSMDSVDCRSMLLANGPSRPEMSMRPAAAAAWVGPCGHTHTSASAGRGGYTRIEVDETVTARPTATTTTSAREATSSEREARQTNGWDDNGPMSPLLPSPSPPQQPPQSPQPPQHQHQQQQDHHHQHQHQHHQHQQHQQETAFSRLKTVVRAVATLIFRLWIVAVIVYSLFVLAHRFARATHLSAVFGSPGGSYMGREQTLYMTPVTLGSSNSGGSVDGETGTGAREGAGAGAGERGKGGQIEPVLAIPALFGRPVSADGLTGPVVVVDAEDGCTPIVGHRLQSLRALKRRSLPVSALADIVALQSTQDWSLLPVPAAGGDAGMAARYSRPPVVSDVHTPAAATATADNATDSVGDLYDLVHWIALVPRGGCPFDEKVYNIQQAGFAVTVVHNTRRPSSGGAVHYLSDSGQDVLVRMSAFSMHGFVRTVALFISHADAAVLGRKARGSEGHRPMTSARTRGDVDGGLVVHIGPPPVHPYLLSWSHARDPASAEAANEPSPLTLLLSDFVLLLISVSVCGSCFLVLCLSLSMLRNWIVYGDVYLLETIAEGCDLILSNGASSGGNLGVWAGPSAPPPRLRSVPFPVRVLDDADIRGFRGDGGEEGDGREPLSWGEGGTGISRDCCAICIEDFVAGAHVRELPCRHIFHDTCVDPWLLKHNRLCPICKRDVLDPCLTPKPTLGTASASSSTLVELPATQSPISRITPRALVVYVARIFFAIPTAIAMPLVLFASVVMDPVTSSMGTEYEPAYDSDMESDVNDDDDDDVQDLDGTGSDLDNDDHIA